MDFARDRDGMIVDGIPWAIIARWRSLRDDYPITIAPEAVHSGQHGSWRWFLWALALEIDEREATRTGEQVCRACGGRGEVIVAWFPAGSYPGCERWLRWREPPATWADEDAADRRLYLRVRAAYEGATLSSPSPLRVEVGGDDRLADPAIVTEPCPCTGPTRPDTICLHNLVADLAGMSIPRSSWPDEWLVRHDERADAGGWIAEWWRIFAEWTLRGKEPDADELAPMLAALIPELEAREKAKRRARWDHLIGVVSSAPPALPSDFFRPRAATDE